MKDIIRHTIYCINCAEEIQKMRIRGKGGMITLSCPKCNTVFELSGFESAFGDNVELGISLSSAGINEFLWNNHDNMNLQGIFHCPFCGPKSFLKERNRNESPFFQCINSACMRVFKVINIDKIEGTAPTEHLTKKSRSIRIRGRLKA